MPLANPTPSSTLGARTPSSAAPSPPAHPTIPSPLNPPSPLALFMQVLHIAFIVLQAITRRMNADLDCLTLLQGCQAAGCLYSIIRIKLTLELHPERITPAELRRLAKASRYINRLARRKIDFSPFLDEDDDASGARASSPALANAASHSDNPQSDSDNPQSDLPRHDFRPRTLNGLRQMSASNAPGATLANVCQTLARLLKLLPDLEYDPSAPIPLTGSADVSSSSALSQTHFATPSPTLGARTPSSAAPLTPAHPIASSPTIPHHQTSAFSSPFSHSSTIRTSSADP